MIRQRYALAFTALSLLALSLPTIASCADSDSASPPSDSSTVLDGGDAGLDANAPEASLTDATGSASCDAADPSCVSVPRDCAEVDWCPVSTGIDPRFALTSVWGSSKSDVWAVGSGGTIVHYDGSKWNAVPSGVQSTLYAVWSSGPKDVWAAGSSKVVLHSTDASTFTPVPVSEEGVGRVFAMWGTLPGELFVGGEPHEQFNPDLEALVSSNWFRRPSGDADSAWELLQGFEGQWPAATIRAIWGSSANDLWVSADNSTELPWMRGVLMHRDGGGVWKSVDSQSSRVLESIWGSSANDVWAVGDEGTLRHFTAGAERWAVVTPPSSAALHAIWGSSANDVWAVGDLGTVIHYDGTSWTNSSVAFPIGKKPNLYGIWGSSADDVWIVGDELTLHFTGSKPGGDR
ncbi:hypothetical protein AKJ09_04075 [Labilithrix luteola]|uniref:Type IV fimbrial biogenesis protein PilY1 n=1 Tax=Labilithrix luteola TaxID=1391654 RepID=A0A0K1PVL1_9BACT|nr:hypothetical protein [Labilithrix luteola]AKU97411.1 hypothetical protein AKJ09_04075 [Labilithrix luteola]